MYYMKSFDVDVFTLESVFPLVNVDIDDKRWEDFNNINGRNFYWLNIDSDSAISTLVYVPFAVIQHGGEGKIIPIRIDAKLTIMGRADYGMHIVTGNGRNILLCESLAAARFAYPTKEELMTYKRKISCPEKYEKSIHRFVRKALCNYM